MYTEEGLTPVQKKMLSFIADCVRERGFPPTLREIASRLRLPAPSSVAYHLKVLQSKGLLKRLGSLSRGLALPEHMTKLPILGRVGAGGGMVAQEDVEGFLDLSKGADFALRVRGDSMEGAGIFEGDLVLVQRQEEAQDGDLVVALVQDEGVVKRLKRRRLESANPAYPPITEGFKVIGKVKGLVRRF